MAGRKPKPLTPGATIGVVAPASPVAATVVEKAKLLLEERGYRVVVGDHVLDRLTNPSYIAGTDADRAADVNRFFANPNIDAVWCAGGGYGSMRLFDLLDWETIACNPKLFIGFSDITSMHLAIARAGGYVTIHGMMFATLLKANQRSKNELWQLLESTEPLGMLPIHEAPLATVVEGVTEGELLGGCLTLLARTCGSRLMPDFQGKIVLLEDVGEALYRVDRDLHQLRNAGVFDEAAGVVIGQITRWKEQEPKDSPNTPESLWHEFFAPLGKPTLSGFPFGHQSSPLSLPLGVRARLDATSKTLTLLESAVSP